MVLREGMTIALEPMLLAGSYYTRVMPDEWTVVSADGRLTAHQEHTVAITADSPYILTVLDDADTRLPEGNTGQSHDKPV
jgi:methionyl aminopeptidase